MALAIRTKQLVSHPTDEIEYDSPKLHHNHNSPRYFTPACGSRFADVGCHLYKRWETWHLPPPEISHWGPGSICNASWEDKPTCTHKFPPGEVIERGSQRGHHTLHSQPLSYDGVRALTLSLCVESCSRNFSTATAVVLWQGLSF